MHSLLLKRHKDKYVLLLEVKILYLVDVNQPSILDALTKSKTTTKKAPTLDSSDSEGKAKKSKPVLKRKQTVIIDSDSSSDDLMSRLKGKTTTAGKVSLNVMSERSLTKCESLLDYQN